jgi:uroporphyrinogen-III synthase
LCAGIIAKRSGKIIEHKVALDGLKVLNTRPKEQAQILNLEITNANGISVELPTIEIVPASNEWLDAIPNLSKVNQIIFTSQNAAIYFIKGIYSADIILPESVEVTAIGEGSAGMLNQLAVNVNYIPDIPNSEQLLALENMRFVDKQCVLLIKGSGGRDLIAKTLSARGANILPVIVYHRAIPVKNNEYVNSIWRNNAVDIILFTSQQAMENLFILFGDEARDWILSKPCLVISQRLADAAKSLGIKKVIVTKYNDIMVALEGFKYDN